MTIFGFNTDIKVDETVYHVQTEVRQQERRLESQVFVSGRCIGKRWVAMPHSDSDAVIQEMARNQHRWVVEAVREGFVDDVLNQAPETLVVQFLGAQRVDNDSVILKFRVLSSGALVANAKVGAQWLSGTSIGELNTTYTDEGGVAEMQLALLSGSAELLVRAESNGHEASRRFLLRPSAN